VCNLSFGQNNLGANRKLAFGIYEPFSVLILTANICFGWLELSFHPFSKHAKTPKKKNKFLISS